MAFKVCTIFFLLAMACLIAESSISASPDDMVEGVTRSSTQTCNGLIGECIDEENELMMDSKISRRSLFQPKRHISYEALKKNRAYCGKPGMSYYDCHKPKQANPYTRGCSILTHCARIIS
ncbi:protein RALF-like 19 [Papaver somniferum]|uniref:protein RALF-like 19 n=1 Tax=Papaver somniferum TaxID=3469 RepID=UPI000E6FC9FD|nr:protein RALF-like 19 [Papaver somniferum]